jgi:hypothetical protein
MFEDEDDAVSYAIRLEAQDFPSPSVETLEQQEIEEFCQSAGYECQIVPKGFVPQTEAERLLLSPPEKSLEKTDWQTATDDVVVEEPEESPMPDADLERIRRQLEGLL